MPQSAWTLRTRTPCDRQQWSIRRCGDRISSAERRPAAQVEVDQALPSARRGSLVGWCPEGLQPIDVLLLFSSASRVAWAISLALCRSKSISDRVNIRGPGEIPSFRLSKAVEGVTELGPPPLLEVPSVLFSELIQLLLGVVQNGRVGLAGQPTTPMADPPAVSSQPRMAIVPPWPMKSSTKMYSRPRTTSPSNLA